MILPFGNYNSSVNDERKSGISKFNNTFIKKEKILLELDLKQKRLLIKEEDPKAKAIKVGGSAVKGLCLVTDKKSVVDWYKFTVKKPKDKD